MAFAPFLTLNDASVMTLGFGLTATFPPLTSPGYRVWLLITSNNGTGITDPTGWTLVGSKQNYNGGTSGLYYRDYQAGDGTSITFVTGSGGGNTAYACWITKGSGSTSIQTDGGWDTTNASSSSATAHYQPASPARKGNLRMFLTCTALQATFDGYPAVTPYADNPGGIKPSKVGILLNSGVTINIFMSVMEDASGTDGSAFTVTGTLPFGNPTSITRTITLDDGSEYWDSADEYAPFEVASEIEMYDPAIGGVKDDSADAIWWGGGPELTADGD